MIVELIGKPIAKQRPRFFKRGGIVKTYDAQHKDKACISNLLKAAVGDIELDSEKAYMARVVFFMPIPLSETKSNRNALAWGLKSHVKKPDLSNMLKFYEDCANSIIYHDDSQLVTISMHKRYSVHPRVIVDIEEIPEMDLNEQIEDILSMIGPDHVAQLIADVEALKQSVYEMGDLQGDNFRPVEANDEQDYTILAKEIWKIAKRHANTLKKIKTRYPNLEFDAMLENE